MIESSQNSSFSNYLFLSNFLQFCLRIFLFPRLISVKIIVALQKIFMEYKQPFAITFFGTSLMVVYLPIAFLREWICSMVDKNVLKRLYRGNKNLSSSNDLDTPLRSNDMQQTLQSSARSCSISDADLSAREEGKPLITNHSEDGSQQNFELSSWEIAKFSLCLAPIWFLNEVLVFCMTYCMLL